MGIIDATFDSIGGVLSDQWKDIVTSRPFTEHSLVVPGIRKRTQDGRGSNDGSEDILSNGSIIFVPENTAAFIFSQGGIEQVITQAGGYEYRDGEASVFDEQDRREKGFGKILLGQAADRFGFSGMSSEEKRVAFVNLREIRGITFGTRGPLVYGDQFYGTDLEVYAYGTFTAQVVDAERCIRGFVPAGVSSYSFDTPEVRGQMLSEFLHSFIVAVGAMSESCRISQLPAQADAIAAHISDDSHNAGTWEERFGIRLISVAIENIEFSDESRALVHQFSERKMSVRAYEDVSQKAANVAAQQMIAQGVRDNGMGDAGGMVFGMGFAGALDPHTAERGGGAGSAEDSAAAPHESLGDQIEVLQKLKGLLDAGILTEEEFNAKKRQVLGL